MILEFLLRHASVITILGGALALLGGFLSNKKTERENKSTNSKIETGHQKTEQNIQLTRQVELLAAQNKSLIETNVNISKSNHELQQKNFELIGLLNKKTDDTYGYITGEESFCIIGLLFPEVGNEEDAVLTIYNIGSNPLSNITIRILRDDNPPEGKNLLNDMGESFQISVLRPKTTTLIKDQAIKLNRKRENRITYIINTNSGNFRQISWYRFFNGNWESEDKLYDAENNKLILWR